MAKIILEVGRSYKTRTGDAVTIVGLVDEAEKCYGAGFRFRDQNKESYKADGHWTFASKKHDKDLVEEVHAK